MLIIPAIDLLDGKCVRLTEGNFKEKSVYSNNPNEIAEIFKKSGAKKIHIIDLDGAKSGKSENREIIKNIKKKFDIKIETGGGIRTENDVGELLDVGIDSLILGTVLVENIDLVKKWIKVFGADKFIAGIDVKDRKVRTKGWLDDKGLDAISFGKKIFDLGIDTTVYTDINKDGKLEGPNIDETNEFILQTGFKVILSGGISNIEDVAKTKNIIKNGLSGIIIGKAYYEGKIDLSQAINKYQD